MHSLLKYFFKDKFIKASFIFFISLMLSNIINYLFQLIMGRLLSVETYGEMNSLFSIIMMMTMVLTPVSYYFAHETAQLYSLGNINKTRGLYHYAYTRFGLVLTLFILSLTIFSKYIGNYINISPLKVILALLFCLVSISYFINNGFIQGFLNFRLLATLLILLAVFKLFFSFFLVLYGFGIYGILIGLLLSGASVGLLSYIVLNKKLLKWRHETFVQIKGRIKHYLLPMIISNMIFGTLTQIDVILVRHFFAPYDAGIYASASIIGKSVMHLPLAIVMSLFPTVSSEKAKDKSTLHILVKALILNTALSGTGVIILFFFPKSIINLLFGKKYLSAFSIVGFFSATMFIMGLISIMMNYLLALREVKFIYALFISLVIEITFIYFFHARIHHILVSILASSLVSLLVFSTLILLKVKDDQK